MRSFLSILDAAKELAEGDSAPDAIERWLALLVANADQLHAIKSWTTNHNTIPGGTSYLRPSEEWRVPLQTFHKWCRSNGYVLQSPPQAKSRQLGQKQQATDNWKLQVQAEAAMRWTNLRKAGANPTKFSLKNDLANWCRTTGVKTKTGVNPSAEYIYRHALRNWVPPSK